MSIHSDNPQDQAVIERVYAAGQEHVFRYRDQLDDASRQKLLAQLREVDFELLHRLYEKHIARPEESGRVPEFEPADVIRLPKTDEERQRFDRARRVGEEALRDGRVAAFLVAGGQGSRLGFPGPKGKFPITPVKNKTLFQLHAEKILAMSRRHGMTIPWYIMTSETNHQETVEFFEEQRFFGLRADDVMFFRQEMIPAMDPKGRLILDAKDHIFTNPNGHGGSLSALKRSGALDDMRRRGIDLIFYFQVDNVLLKMCDPVFLGFHLKRRAEMSAKMAAKCDPQEKVGVLGRVNGRLGVIEYSDLPDDLKGLRNLDGSLKFGAGNIAIHVLNVDFVEKENEGGLRLPWHVAHKKIPYLDDAGRLIEPEEPNGYKFETFVFDALGDAEEAVVLEVRREEEFSPVKNAEGADSPRTARRDLVNLFGRWLEKAGVAVPRDGDGNVRGHLEISPLFALDEEEFLQKAPPELEFKDGLYLV